MKEKERSILGVGKPINYFVEDVRVDEIFRPSKPIRAIIKIIDTVFTSKEEKEFRQGEKELQRNQINSNEKIADEIPSNNPPTTSVAQCSPR